MQIDVALQHIPRELSEALIRELFELKRRFGRKDWGPGELNGGRFAEAILRYLEWKESAGTYTPIGTQLKTQQIVNRIENNPSLSEGLRFHVRRVAELLLDVRNKRDVAHLGAGINVNEMDARLVTGLSSWALAEIVREETRLTPEESQEIVDQITVKEIALVEEVAGDLLVVATDLPPGQRALIALYSTPTNSMEITDLRIAVGYQNSTRFRRKLEEDFVGRRILYIKNDVVHLTKKGIAWVEQTIDLELTI